MEMTAGQDGLMLWLSIGTASLRNRLNRDYTSDRTGLKFPKKETTMLYSLYRILILTALTSFCWISMISGGTQAQQQPPTLYTDRLAWTASSSGLTTIDFRESLPVAKVCACLMKPGNA